MGDVQKFLGRLFYLALWIALQAFILCLALACFFEATQTGWSAPDPNTIYLEPRISPQMKVVYGIGALVFSCLAVYSIVKGWRNCMEVLEGRHDT